MSEISIEEHKKANGAPSSETVTKPTAPKADISFKSPFDDTVFNLRYIYFDEELTIDAQNTAIADLEKGREKDEKSFRIYLGALVKFAFTDTDAKAYEKKYSEFTAKNQRIVTDAFVNYRRVLNGDENF